MDGGGVRCFGGWLGPWLCKEEKGSMLTVVYDKGGGCGRGQGGCTIHRR